MIADNLGLMVKNVSKAGMFADNSGLIGQLFVKKCGKSGIIADFSGLFVKKCGKSRMIADYSGYFQEKYNKSGMFADNIWGPSFVFHKNVNKSGIIADLFWGLPICFYKNKLINPECLPIIFDEWMTKSMALCSYFSPKFSPNIVILAQFRPNLS